jgi:MYXO-CTERM domain-containing protein
MVRHLLAGREEEEMSRTTLPRRQSVRRTGVLALLLGPMLGMALAVILPAAAADAAAYRYWGYYQLSGTTWSCATKGADQTTPADGSVDGWRFAVGTEDTSRFPRATPTFDQVCGTNTAGADEKRVAVVIDYGRTADTADNSQPPAAVGRCAVVATSATGLEVLAKVAEVRSDKALICGIDGFPATGCGDEVKTVSPEAKAADTPVTLKLPSAKKDKPAAASEEDSHTGTYVGIGVAVLAALGVGAVALRRRQSA